MAIRDLDTDPALAVRQLRSERLVAVLPADHDAAAGDVRARAGRPARRDLRDPSLGSPLGDVPAVTEACRLAGIWPAELVEVRETAALVAFVAAGNGVALVPEPVRALALFGVVFRPLSDVDQRTGLVLAIRADEISATVLQVVGLVEA